MTVNGATVRVVGVPTLVSPLSASPATAANCILTDYQHEAVNHQQEKTRGKESQRMFPVRGDGRKIGANPDKPAGE